MSGAAPAGLREGCAEAFRAVYDAELEHVMTVLGQGFLLRRKDGGRTQVRISGAQDVEELTQEAFSRFYAQCLSGRFDTARPVRPYLRRIAMNLALAHLGKAYREDLHESLDDAVEQPAVDRLEDQECVRLVNEFRDALGPNDRAVLDHYYQEGRASQAEVGARCGMSRDQVYRALQRIRGQARAFFSERGWFDG